MIAMNDPFNYVDAAAHAAQRLDIETLDLVDPVGKDFCIDTTKARYVLGYRPKYDICALIDKAVEFRRAGTSGGRDRDSRDNAAAITIVGVAVRLPPHQRRQSPRSNEHEGSRTK